jgi:Phosphotransferase enzyme family
MTLGQTRLAERERNRLLRRVDWRFLLSDPCLGRVLCLARGELRDACALVAASVNHSAPNADSSPFDVVVLADPDRHLITAAHERLRSGGELYVEWSGTRQSDIERLLSDSGFRDVRCYAPWPSPPSTEVWVPLDVPWVLDYCDRVDRTVYVGLRHRFGVRARRAVARWRLARQASPVVCAIGRKPHDRRQDSAKGHDASPTPPVIHAARAEARLDASVGLTIALLTGGPRAISKVVGLVYGSTDREPAFAVKWPRVPESEAGLVREADALAASHARGPAPGVPRLLGRTGVGARLAIAESAAHGVPLFTRLSRENVESFTRLGASWLADFNTRERRPSPDRDTLRDMTAREIQRFDETFGPIIDPALLDETRRLCADIADVPSVIEHRDFGPWNIFVDETRRLTVLDWESSRLRGLPLLDLIYFVSYIAFFVEGAMVSRRFADVYRSTLDERSPIGRLRQELIEQHRELLGISGTAVRVLRALCWIGHAESEFQHFSADAGGSPSVDALRASVFVRLWREEITSLR